MLGKLRKGDTIYTNANHDPMSAVMVDEVIKLKGEVILVRGLDYHGQKVAIAPSEIKDYTYNDCMSTAMMPLEDSIEEQTEENLKKMGILPKDLTLDEFMSGVSSTQRGTTSPTGSLRYNTGKPQMSNIPPEFLLEMAKVMTEGAKKYGKFNYKKGNYMSVPYDSAMRHIFAFINGQNLDDETQCHHLAHAAVNLMFMYIYQKRNPEMDDREEMR